MEAFNQQQVRAMLTKPWLSLVRIFKGHYWWRYVIPYSQIIFVVPAWYCATWHVHVCTLYAALQCMYTQWSIHVGVLVLNISLCVHQYFQHELQYMYTYHCNIIVFIIAYVFYVFRFLIWMAPNKYTSHQMIYIYATKLSHHTNLNNCFGGCW